MSDRTSLKAELLVELKEQLESQIEEEVREEVSEEMEELQSKRRYSLALNNFKTYLFAFAAVIMALGQFSEAVSLIEDGVNTLRSRFTNTVEYDLLARVHVGNTDDYISELLGNPQVSRAIDETVVANYYHTRKFLLTIFIEDERVVAYTYVPLLSNFEPNIIATEEYDWILGGSNYSEFPANPKRYMVDHSKTTSYYIESLDTGRTGLFIQHYLGNVPMGVSEKNPFVGALYEFEIVGEESEIVDAQGQLRQGLKPNFYGMGKLDLEKIQSSLLTVAEFSNYFGNQ